MKKRPARHVWDLLHPMSGVAHKYEVYHLTSHRRTIQEFHSHDFFELYFFLSGDASMYVGQSVYSMRPGDVFILPPGHMHRPLHHTQHSYYDRFFIYISRDTLAHMGSEDCPLSSLMDAAVSGGSFRCHPPEKEFSAAITQLSGIILSSAHADAAQRLINDCEMTILLTRLCKWFALSQSPEAPAAPHVIAQVLAFIGDNLSGDLSLDALSSRFFINKYHLLREFKNHTQLTLYQYILSRRITHAKNLLRSGVVPDAVREQCGFNDYSTFYKAFKKQTGLSPSQYVRLLENSSPGGPFIQEDTPSSKLSP